jgi:hypothetical protein
MVWPRSTFHQPSLLYFVSRSITTHLVILHPVTSPPPKCSPPLVVACSSIIPPSFQSSYQRPSSHPVSATSLVPLAGSLLLRDDSIELAQKATSLLLSVKLEPGTLYLIPSFPLIYFTLYWVSIFPRYHHHFTKTVPFQYHTRQLPTEPAYCIAKSPLICLNPGYPRRLNTTVYT